MKLHILSSIELPKEHIAAEWKKLLLKSLRPSIGLDQAMQCGVFTQLHPEFASLPGTPQDPVWHPEGDVWTHTLKVVDHMAAIIRRENVNDEDAFPLMLAALCHDLGKPATTLIGYERITSPGHEGAGENPSRSFLESIGMDLVTIEKVVMLVKNHLVPVSLYAEETVRRIQVSDGAIRRLTARIHPATIYQLALLSEADRRGRGIFANPEGMDEFGVPMKIFKAGIWLMERAKLIDAERYTPGHLIRGKDLTGMGFRPSPEFRKLISLADTLRDEMNVTRERLLDAIRKEKDISTAISCLEHLLNPNDQNDRI